MKKVLVLAALAALVATSATAGVVGTKHDLSSAGGASIKTDATEVCVFCHTPHGANATTGKYLPLWNRNQIADPIGFYDTISMNNKTTAALTAATDAYLCLSCHDGVTSVDALRNPPNSGLTTAARPVTGNFIIGGSTKDLSNDHPIGMQYNSTNDGELVPAPGTAVKFFGTAVGADLGTMWCSSCHDVHGGVANTPFLQVSNVASALCTTCHAK